MSLHKMHRILALPMALVLFLEVGPLPLAHAAIVPTEHVMREDAAAGERARVMHFLAREDVRREMEALGINPKEAAARTKALSDEEIARIANTLDEAAAGQNAIAAIVGAIVLIFLVLLITDLLCLTRVFPFTRCPAKS
jgi:cytochrome c1